MNELKACPFCGGMPISVSQYNEEVKAHECFVMCSQCGCRSRSYTAASFSEMVTASEKAEAAWNIRKAQATL